LKTSK
ncbi:hypothetical protein VCHENC02_1102B, partial [Vibrio harveyi]